MAVQGQDLAARSLSYDAVGATRPQDERWLQQPEGYRSFERTVRLGDGDACWERASSALLSWGVKTRSGFTVEPVTSTGTSVVLDDRRWLLARVGPVVVREPVQVVAVVQGQDRRGFAYGTLEGHPVSGEEAFIVSRTPDGAVRLTLRSLTRAPRGPWRAAFPVAVVAQRWYRRRYARALVDGPLSR